MPRKAMFDPLRSRMILRENRIYIMPTGRGVLFLAIVIVLILTAATYNNNLIFILAFLLFALFWVSMLQTHYNLKGVKLEYLSGDETFAGEPLTLLFSLLQRRHHLKPALHVRSGSARWKTRTAALVALQPSEAQKPVRIAVEAPGRGVHPLPTVILETFFPVGLFRAWKVFHPRGELIVYPKPEGQSPLRATGAKAGEEDGGLGQSPEGDFGELKNYQTGESYHQIAWKHYARTGALYSKVHWGDEPKHYRIRWQATPAVENELRQLSAWIEQALQENASFELELPATHIESGSGQEQARLCWRALARYRTPA